MLGPFDTPAPSDVPLPKAPLVRVLAQVRFPQFSHFVGDDDRVAQRFAAEVADRYPLFEQGHEVVVTITPEGVGSAPSGAKLWRLSNANATEAVAFAHNFLTIETSVYDTRAQFARRFADIWEAFRCAAPPPFVERVGVRYINHVSDPDVVGRVHHLLNPAIRGVAGVPSTRGQLVKSLTEAAYRFADGGEFQARWGLLPAGASLDPSVPVSDVPAWVLDLDSSHNWHPGANLGHGIAELSSSLASRAYQFFRWATLPSFLSEFGGMSP